MPGPFNPFEQGAPNALQMRAHDVVKAIEKGLPAEPEYNMLVGQLGGHPWLLHQTPMHAAIYLSALIVRAGFVRS